MTDNAQCIRLPDRDDRLTEERREVLVCQSDHERDMDLLRAAWGWSIMS